MNLQTIKTDQYWLLVDTEAKGVIGDLFWDGRTNPQEPDCPFYWIEEDDDLPNKTNLPDMKVIAYLSIDNAPLLKGVPVLDDIKYCMKHTEANFDWLIKQDYELRSGSAAYERPYIIVVENKKWFWLDSNNNGLLELPKQEEDVEKLESIYKEPSVKRRDNLSALDRALEDAKIEAYLDGHFYGFEAGYKAASQGKMYSKEQVKDIFVKGLQFGSKNERWSNKRVDEYLKSLSTIQKDEWVFEPEWKSYWECHNYNGAHLNKDCSCKSGDLREINKLKTIPHPEFPDNPIVVGKWIRK